ncbi:MAG: winged helix-turn-helix domain-containing protein, partial [Actinocatenispora sp.]
MTTPSDSAAAPSGRPDLPGPADDAPRAATPRTARLINDRAAFDLLLTRGPLTRTELRALTGLSRPTVADLIERLRGAGLVAAAGEAGAQRRGPNATLYGVVADRALVAGVEVRPASVVAVLADITGHTVGRAERPLDPVAAPDAQVLA